MNFSFTLFFNIKDSTKLSETYSNNCNSEIMIPGEKAFDPTSNTLVKISEAAEKLSKKKEKDLQKYISKKLKKDERSSLLDRLQKATVNRGDLESSRCLGQGQKCKAERTWNDDSDSSTDVQMSTNYSPFNHSPALSAEIIEKDPFKSTKDILAPSFLESSSDDSSSDNDLDDGSTYIPTTVSFLADIEPVFNVHVERDSQIQDQRSQLPIFAEEQSIMEAIKGNPVVIICGETGSGKTTQVPQFLYEAGFGNKASSNPGMIAVTQPRRVAAISMASRVGNELNDPSLVAYQIRYDSSTVNSKSAIKFMTDGILLREIQSDFLLTRYSIVLLDEAHERNINTDILVGLLSRIVKLRWRKANEPNSSVRPLRLVIMSATLNVDEFSKPTLFNPLPPVLRVEARQHPVNVHFNRKTNPDYLDEALKTVSKIHSNLPDGGILVFLSGKREIMTLVQNLRTKFPTQNEDFRPDKNINFNDFLSVNEADFASDVEDESMDDETKEAFLGNGSSSSCDESDSDNFVSATMTKKPLHVLPLFSLMSPEQQMRIFEEPPKGSRLCVVATNIAETSITIKNIRYVVDSGKVKQRIWDSEGRQKYEVGWTSKASVSQRTGRAGRTGPGHCYRLFSSAVFDNDFLPHSSPEISRIPMENLVMQLKNMTIDNVERFPLPTQPDTSAVLRAQNQLIDLGILDRASLTITEFGKTVASLPLSPSWGSFLVHAINIAKSQESAKRFITVTAAFVSVMSVGDPFDLDSRDDSMENVDMQSKEKDSEELIHNIDWRMFCGKPVVSDLFASLGAFLEYLKQSPTLRTTFCNRNRLIKKRLEEMSQQLLQLIKICGDILNIDLSLDVSDLDTKISSEQKLFLRRLIAKSFPFQIAEKVSITFQLNDPNRKLASKLPTYRVLGASPNDSLRFLHPSSLLSKIPPKFLVFTESLSVNDRKTSAVRHYIKNVTAIEPNWIPSQTLAKAI